MGLVSPKVDPAFVTTGFCYWKKAVNKFESLLIHSLAAFIASRNTSESNLIQRGFDKE